MEIEILKEKLRSAKLHPVHVEGSPVDEGTRGNRFIGSLEEYLDAMRAIAAPAIFIRTEAFDEWHFFHAPEGQDELPDDDAEPVDLRRITTALRAFERHLGTIAMYKLSSTLTADSLDFVINEPWWIEFLKLRETATDQVDGDLAASEAKSRADQQARDRNALSALGGLLSNPNFARLPTQKAMIAFAIDQIPELASVDENALKIEIQNLHAKIKAKALDRKR